MTQIITRSNPPTVHAPVGVYSHVVSVAAGARRVVLAGQVGVRLDGTVPDDVDEQIAQMISNIKANLASEGLTSANIVKFLVYITDAAIVPNWRKQRDSLIGEHVPASTVILIAGLPDPRFKIEIDLEAAG